MSNKLNKYIGLAPPFERWKNYKFSVSKEIKVNKKKLKYFKVVIRRVYNNQSNQVPNY